ALPCRQSFLSSSMFPATSLSATCGPGRSQSGALRSPCEYVVDNTVIFCLARSHDVVAIRILLDARERLAGVVRQNFIEALAHAQDFLRMDVDVARLARDPRHPGLMDEDPRVRQRETFPFGTRCEQHGRHRRSLTDAVRLDVRLDELHRVVNRQ